MATGLAVVEELAARRFLALTGEVGQLVGSVEVDLVGLSPAGMHVPDHGGAGAGGALPPKMREQIALAVSEANGCQYCVSVHSAIGKRLGLAEAELTASRDGASSDPKAQAALPAAATSEQGEADHTRHHERPPRSLATPSRAAPHHDIAGPPNTTSAITSGT